MSIFTPGRRWQRRYSPFKKETFGNRGPGKCRIRHQKSAVCLPHVRELACCRRRLHLPDGMPQGPAQRPVRRLHPGQYVTWIRRVRASGNKIYEAAPSSMKPPGKCLWKCCPAWIWEKVGTENLGRRGRPDQEARHRERGSKDWLLPKSAMTGLAKHLSPGPPARSGGWGCRLPQPKI